MKLTWYGQSCFHISTKTADLVIDPYGEEIGLKLPKLRADIVLKTHDHFDHNNIGAVQGVKKGERPFLIEGPGEYNIKGISIDGIASYHDQKQGAERGPNTIYALRAEGLRLVHLGDLGQKELSAQQLDALNGVEILLVPVGGNYTIDGAQAVQIVHQIEPQVVIPMHYKIKGLKVDIDDESSFLKELGESPQPQESFKFGPQDKRESDGFEVVVLKPAIWRQIYNFQKPLL